MAGRVTAQTDGVDALSQNRGGANAGPIRAAGGVVTRREPDGPRVALVHRPRHDDWSLPKGKLRRGEHPVVAARREVWEETGVRAFVGARLPTVSYQVQLGLGDEARLVDKVVDFWVMRSVNGVPFVPGDETDELAWLTTAEAQELATYERDVMVLGAFADLPPLRDPVVLVRHARAGVPERWSGPDDMRPLDRAGAARAAAFVETLACFGPVRLVSATPLRCVQTLAPLAAAVGLEVEVDIAFDENADVTAAADRVRDLGRGAGAAVICSQGKLIPPLLAALAGGEPASYSTAKGAGWVLSLGPTGAIVLDPLP
jgi:8-oxo-dGTP pyrophosphatase MutT (NUDIX family)/phosphohistidine phosphatase SixA